MLQLMRSMDKNPNGYCELHIPGKLEFDSKTDGI